MHNLSTICPLASVLRMEEDELESLASEPRDVARKRREKEERLCYLQESLRICKKNMVYVPRGEFICIFN